MDTSSLLIDKNKKQHHAACRLPDGLCQQGGNINFSFSPWTKVEILTSLFCVNRHVCVTRCQDVFAREFSLYACYHLCLQSNPTFSYLLQDVAEGPVRDVTILQSTGFELPSFQTQAHRTSLLTHTTHLESLQTVFITF